MQQATCQWGDLQNELARPNGISTSASEPVYSLAADLDQESMASVYDATHTDRLRLLVKISIRAESW